MNKVLKALHKELAELYENQSTDVVRMKQLWTEIEKLEAREDE